MGFPAGVTVTLVHVTPGAGRDRWNNVVDTETSEVIEGVAWVPMQTSESTQGAEEIIGNAEAYFADPPSQAISPLDKILYNGKTYQVYGDTSLWTSPFTAATSPLMVRLREVSGAAAHSSTTSSGE